MSFPPAPDGSGRWIPVGAGIGAKGVFVRWLQIDGCDFRRPFFRQAITIAAEQQAGFLRRDTALDEMEALCAKPLSAPAGLIFHMSRCGSTLVSRMLAVDGGTLVVSEPDPINDMLGPHWLVLPEFTRRRALRLMIAALGDLRRPDQRDYVIKFSNWNASHLSSLLADLRGIPKLFVYRDPVEVLTSLTSEPPQWASLQDNAYAASVFVGVAPEEVAPMDPAEFRARVVRTGLTAILARYDETWLLVNYDELPEAVYGRIVGFFGLPRSAESVAEMRAIAGIHARDVHMRRPFTDDRAHKRRTASPAILAAAARWLEEPYRRLEALRIERKADSDS